MDTTEQRARFYLVREPDIDTAHTWSIFNADGERVGEIVHVETTPGLFYFHRIERGDVVGTGRHESIDACAIAITGHRELTLVWS